MPLIVGADVDTSYLLEGDNIADLWETYIRTLPKEKKRYPTLNGYLLKYQNIVFAFEPILAILVSAEPESAQTISKTLQEYYTGVIASLLHAGEAHLPTQLRIGACIHHPSHNHWTTLLIECKHDENAKKEYDALYEEYKKSPQPEGDEPPANSINDVKNFLKDKKKIIFSGDTREISSNWKLPLTPSFSLTHYDSLNGTNAYKEIEISAKDFLREHKATLTAGESTKQKGNTCGDWAVYNAFTHSLPQRIRTEPKPPSSEALRFLSENRSIANAKKILSRPKKKRLQFVAKKDNISVKNEHRALARTLPPLHIAPTAPPEEKGAFNNLYPWINLTSRILFTGLGGYIASTLIPATVLFPLFSFPLGVGIGFFIFPKLIKDLFGCDNLILNIEKENFEYSRNPKNKKGVLQDLGFPIAAYHDTLEEIEKRIEELLVFRTDLTPEKKIVLIHHYTRKIYKKFPNSLYDCDIQKVNEKDYVDEEQVKKIFLTPS